MFYDVVKVHGTKFFAVSDWNDNFASAGYRDRPSVERMARNMTIGLFDAAEEYDARRSGVLAYLAARKDRVPAIAAQIEFNF